MIGKNITYLRKRKGYSLTELAEKANVSKSYLSNIERNLNKNPSLQVMEKIAKVLQVKVDTLLNPCKKIPEEFEKEWLDFLKELKKSGIEKESIPNIKIIIDFLIWQKTQESRTK